jgi:hypothetical protein
LDNGRISVIRDTIGDFHNKHAFPPEGFPENLILAIIAQESGFDNEVNKDGLMQVTKKSGEHREGLYINNIQGILANMEDGLTVLMDFYEYSNNNIIGSVWRYNSGLQPYWTYYHEAEIDENGNWRYAGDIGYLGHVANKYVENDYGDENSDMVKQLRSAQQEVTNTLDQIEEIQGKNLEEIHNSLVGDGELQKIGDISIFRGGLAKGNVWIPGDEWIKGQMHSPSEFRVYDSQLRITGLVNEKIKNEIPNSIYSDSTIVILLPSDSYKYEVAGKEEGTYGLDIASVGDGDVTIFTATDIPTHGGAVNQYTIDWNTISQGEEGVTIKVDSDGDGTFEQTITSDSELTHEEFVLQTTTCAGDCYEGTVCEGTLIMENVNCLVCLTETGRSWKPKKSSNCFGSTAPFDLCLTYCPQCCDGIENEDSLDGIDYLGDPDCTCGLDPSEAAPAPPVPERPTIILFLIGLLALAGYAVLSRQKE